MDVVVFSHLRWDFVYQRPQHLLSRFARDGRVFFVEEPTPGDTALEVLIPATGVTVLRPHVPSHLTRSQSESMQLQLLRSESPLRKLISPVAWLYTPMALPLLGAITPSAVVYDCMDELSAFAGADSLLPSREGALMKRADLVFTGGRSLFEAKRSLHPRVHCFPSSVDEAHYRRARGASFVSGGPAEAPVLGYFGVIDERFDSDLLADVATVCAEWSFQIIGPIVKIDPATLPALPNIAYLGLKPYAELPEQIAKWDVAWIPFARNASTRFISPTKVLEYMAAGKPIVSTSIPDVVNPYGARGLVRIADHPTEVISAAGAAMAEDPGERLERFNDVLASTSWDRTYAEMRALVLAQLERSARLLEQIPRAAYASVGVAAAD